MEEETETTTTATTSDTAPGEPPAGDESPWPYLNTIHSFVGVKDSSYRMQCMLFLPEDVEILSYKNSPSNLKKHIENVVMLMSDFVDWLIPDIPKDISFQIHKEKLLMLDHFMKEEGRRRDNYNHDGYTSPSSGNASPHQLHSRPSFHARAGW